MCVVARVVAVEVYVGSANATVSNPQRKCSPDRRLSNSTSQAGSDVVALPDGMDGNVYIVLHADQAPVLQVGDSKVHGRTRAYVVPSNKNAVVLLT